MDLGLYPTPLQTFDLGAAAPLLVKREDLSGVGFGGNKVRKLRALLDDARARGATTLLTWGGPQSNHCALTAVAARNAGLEVEVFFTGHAEAGRGNGRVHDLLDVPRHEGFTGEADVEEAMAARAEEIRLQGGSAYLVPLGGSSPIGAATYVDAVGELVDQLAAADVEPPAHMVVAAGSLGTLAGIVAGTWVHGLDTEVVGVSVLHPAETAHARLDALLAEMRPHLPDHRPRENHRIYDSQIGEGYGIPTDAGRAAAHEAAARFGLMLDQTYTAKAFAGLLAGVHRGGVGGEFATDRPVLFWHTGGTGGFFA